MLREPLFLREYQQILINECVATTLFVKFPALGEFFFKCCLPSFNQRGERHSKHSSYTEGTLIIAYP